MLTSYIGHAVLFYDSGALRIGIVINEKDSRLEILGSDGHTILLPIARISLTSSEQMLTGKPDAVLAEFQSAVTEAIPDDDALYKDLSGLPEAMPFEEVLLKTGYRGDIQTFALFYALRQSQLYFSHKNGIYRGLSDSERELKAIELATNSKRRAYLDSASCFISQLHPNHQDVLTPLNPEYRDSLASELRMLQMNSQVPDLAALINRADLGASFEDKIIKIRIALNDMDESTDPALASSGLPVVFSARTWQSAISYPFSILPAREAFTIDDASTRDYDDALSLLETNGHLSLGIHISDLAQHVPVTSDLFGFARERVSSIYLPAQTVNMLPEELSNDLLSLGQGMARPCLSLYVDFDENRMIRGWKFVRDQILISNNFTYEEVDTRQKDTPFCKLISIANQLRLERTGSDQVCKEPFVYYLRSNNDNVSIRRINILSPARLMIEEMMVLYNRLAAEYAHQNQIPVIHRNISITEYGTDGFVNSQAFLSTEGLFHPGTGSMAYLHATSPIRRFTDLVNQHQIASRLTGTAQPFAINDLEDMIPAIEERLRMISEVSRASERYWMLRYLEQDWLGVPLDAMFTKKVFKGWQVELLRWNKRVVVECANPPAVQMPVKLLINGVDAWNLLCFGDAIT